MLPLFGSWFTALRGKVENIIMSTSTNENDAAAAAALTAAQDDGPSWEHREKGSFDSRQALLTAVVSC